MGEAGHAKLKISSTSTNSGMGDVVTQKLEAFVIEEMLDIAARAGEEIIHAEDLLPPRQQLLAKMRAQKPRASGHQNPPLKMHVSSPA